MTRKKVLTRKEAESMWQIYWRWRFLGMRPPKEHDHYGIYMYAHHLLHFEKYSVVPKPERREGA